MSLITAVLASSLSFSLASLRWIAGGANVANGAPFDVTLICSPFCAIFKYFSRLALSSLIVTLIMTVGASSNCTIIMYNSSKLGKANQPDPPPRCLSCALIFFVEKMDALIFSPPDSVMFAPFRKKNSGKKRNKVANITPR